MTYSGGLVIRSVAVGGVSRPRLFARLVEAGVQFNDAARTLFASDRFVTSATRQTYLAVEVTVGQFGFSAGATMGELRVRAAACGLCPPPLEMGPHLRLQFRTQPEGYWGRPATVHRAPPGSLTVASAPLSDDDDFPKGFYLRRIKGLLWLRGYHESADHVWAPDDRLIFCRVGFAQPVA